MLPTWILQACLLALFAGGHHDPWLTRRLVLQEAGRDRH
jgi:hypothetical protein